MASGIRTALAVVQRLLSTVTASAMAIKFVNCLNVDQVCRNEKESQEDDCCFLNSNGAPMNSAIPDAAVRVIILTRTNRAGIGSFRLACKP